MCIRDRDLAAYFIYKQSTNIPECEVDAFLDICKDLTVQQCDLLIAVKWIFLMAGCLSIVC